MLEYFDGFIIGLTATPSKQTMGFFNQNLVTEYSHEQAVADGVNVGYDVYRIKTHITAKGSTVQAGYYVDKREKRTRRVRWELLDSDLQYTADQLDRSVVANAQIRTIIQTFRDKLCTEIFPGRCEVPKTLVFAKDDSHAEDIVHIIREEFGKGNDFCKKITYRTGTEDPEQLLASFRNSYNPRIAVTVDMVATGTDVRPLECLLFMRDVKSQTYFEQMKGRGTRTVSPTELRGVSPDARHKTRFVIVDAIGVCETDKTDSRPMERKRSVPFEKLLHAVAVGVRDEDLLSSVAARLARLERALEEPELKEIEKLSAGAPLKKMVSNLVEAIDRDRQEEKAKELFQTETPTEEQVGQAARELANTACQPLADNPALRNYLVELQQKNEQIIDTVSPDTLIWSGYDEQAREQARNLITSFKQFIEDNKDAITALQILYSKPHGQRHLTYQQVKELAEAIEKPPHRLNSERLWEAYERLDEAKVRGRSPERMLTDIVSLVRFVLDEVAELEPFSDTLQRSFDAWLTQQQGTGRTFTAEQREWLEMIRSHIAASLSISVEDFKLTPFNNRGGVMKVYQLFGPELDSILRDMNELMAA